MTNLRAQHHRSPPVAWPTPSNPVFGLGSPPFRPPWPPGHPGAPDPTKEIPSMTTLTVPDIPLDSNSPAQRLRRIAAAVRVSLHWWGTHRSLSAQQKEEVSAGYAADARFLTAGKRIIDV